MTDIHTSTESPNFASFGTSDSPGNQSFSFATGRPEEEQAESKVAYGLEQGELTN